MSNADLPAFRATKLDAQPVEGTDEIAIRIYPAGSDEVTAILVSKTTAARLAVNLIDALQHDDTARKDNPSSNAD